MPAELAHVRVSHNSIDLQLASWQLRRPRLRNEINSINFLRERGLRGPESPVALTEPLGVLVLTERPPRTRGPDWLSCVQFDGEGPGRLAFFPNPSTSPLPLFSNSPMLSLADVLFIELSLGA